MAIRRFACREIAIACALATSTLPTLAAGQFDARSSAAESAALRARGVFLTYSLDYDEARAALQQAIALSPDDPAAYRQLAATNWLNLLFRNGAVMVDDYLGEVKSQVKRGAPPADLDAQFRSAIAKAQSLSEQQLRDRPRDADAHFQVGATQGFVASYTATVEGRVLGGFRAARRAYEEHERALDLDPQRKDAGLIVGLYRYSISYLPFHWRLLARIVGFGSDRERGLELVEDAAAFPADARPEAQFVLIAMYSREARYDDALRVIETLQAEYPRNRLLWLEGGSTALRAGRADDARRHLEIGLAKLAADPRPRALGEEARWRLYYGSALAELHDRERAGRELRAVLTLEGAGWVKGRAHNELGKLADAAGDRASAVREFHTAFALCQAEDDGVCVDDAKALTAGRQTGGRRAVRP